MIYYSQMSSHIHSEMESGIFKIQMQWENLDKHQINLKDHDSNFEFQNMKYIYMSHVWKVL